MLFALLTVYRGMGFIWNIFKQIPLISFFFKAKIHDLVIVAQFCDQTSIDSNPYSVTRVASDNYLYVTHQ